MERPLLLDLDLDFLWSQDYSFLSDYVCVDDEVKNNCPPIEYSIAYPPEKVAKTLLKLKKHETRVHLVVDHHESLFVWDKLNVKQANCIHIDAHHDVWPNSHRGLSMPTTKGSRGDNINCGSYLGQAILDGIVNEVVYVAPKFKRVCDEEDDIKKQLGTLNNITVTKWAPFTKIIHLLPKVDIITIAISPEWSPLRFWSEIETFCKILGVNKRVLSHRKKQATKKWSLIGKVSYKDMSRYDFCFPYSYKS